MVTVSHSLAQEMQEYSCYL